MPSPGSPRLTEYAASMAEAAHSENVAARLAQVREGLKLLADYL